VAPELSPAEILVEVVEAPRRAYVDLDDLRVIERPGWLQLITPSFRHGGFNEVADAGARGITLATSRAGENSSAPLLERLGFATVCRFTSYTGSP
jgi:hypothetical protein